MNRAVGNALMVLAVGLGLWLSGQGLWIQAKAVLAQLLLERSWAQTRAGASPAPPWPWADTRPVARLRATRGDAGGGVSGDVDLIVLAGDSGRTLAFGPGHNSGSAAPGAPGTTVISGHRDTHFRFLQDLRTGDRLELEFPTGSRSYRVSATHVVDATRSRLQADDRGKRLLLVTCYPFDAVAPGGPLRYVVEAEPLTQSPTS